jgi:hypothetical protein
MTSCDFVTEYKSINHCDIARFLACYLPNNAQAPLRNNSVYIYVDLRFT